MNTKPKIIVLGGSGLLGSCLARDLSGAGDVTCLPRHACDVSEAKNIEAVIANLNPDIILNCAGFLNADKCEKDPAQSYAINAGAAITLARTIARIKGRAPKLIHFSSDFVFDGMKGDYSEDDLPRPLGIYGIHKYLADEFIKHSGLEDYWNLRIASVIGLTPERGNFLKTIVKASASKPHLDIVDDLSISMVTTELLADYIMQLWNKKAPSGLYNATAQGKTSWFAIAKQAFKGLGIDYDIRPSTTTLAALAAPRPKLSSLANNKLAGALGINLLSWEDAVSNHATKYKQDYSALRAS